MASMMVGVIVGRGMGRGDMVRGGKLRVGGIVGVVVVGLMAGGGIVDGLRESIMRETAGGMRMRGIGRYQKEPGSEK